jgi:hypothetical protein
MESRFTILVEGPLALLQLVPLQFCRNACFLLYAALLFGINSTGNYGHLGLLSLVQFLSLVDDSTLFTLFGRSLFDAIDSSTLWRFILQNQPLDAYASYALALGCVLISPYMLISLLFPFHSTVPASLAERFASVDAKLQQWKTEFKGLYKKLAPWLKFGRYVKFAGMTTFRNELIIQVCDDNGTWHQWDCRYKPCSVDRRPPVVIGKMPGIDWQLWFIPLDISRNGRYARLPMWLVRMLQLALEGDAAVMQLLDEPPIEPQSFKRIRLLLYEYKYATQPQQGFEVGSVWQRKLIGQVSEVIEKKLD